MDFAGNVSAGYGFSSWLELVDMVGDRERHMTYTEVEDGRRGAGLWHRGRTLMRDLAFEVLRGTPTYVNDAPLHAPDTSGRRHLLSLSLPAPAGASKS